VRYFTRKGDPKLFSCSCGECDVAPTTQLLFMLDDARSKAGIPFVVSSGPRCPTYNKEVGGSPASDHLLGQAADIQCSNSTQRYTMMKAGLEAGFTRIGISSAFIHLGYSTASPYPSVWLY